jgi:hypothetical protein
MGKLLLYSQVKHLVAESTQVLQFLGFTGWYQSFIKDYATITIPLTNLNKKGTIFKWNEECEHAFKYLKEKMAS